jgi:ATP-dependent Clp protease ATP-binding subunit ClpA
MARTIQEHIKQPLAEELLFGRLENGGTVRVIVKTGEDDSKTLDFEIIEASRKPKKSADDNPSGSAPKSKAKKTTLTKGAGRSTKKPAPENTASGRGSLVPKVPLAP